MPTGAQLYYFKHIGDASTYKPPVVLLHGAAGNHLHWPPEIRRLAGYRVFTPDLPGHGKSGGIGLQSIADYAHAVNRLLDEIGLSRAVIIGHSMGGAIALALALEHAPRVAGLGLLASGARMRVAPGILDNAISPTTFSMAVRTIGELAFSPRTASRIKELAINRMADTRPAVLHGDFLACDGFDVMDHLNEIHCPTLVVCGVDDQLTPLRYSRYLADKIPGAHLEVVESAGHMVMLEQTRLVAKMLVTFLAEVPFRPGM